MRELSVNQEVRLLRAAYGRRSLLTRTAMVPIATAAMFCLVGLGPAGATEIIGTVHLQGQVEFSAPIAGIALEDLVVDVGIQTEATVGGTKCEILGTTNDNPDVAGNYPDAGDVSADISALHNGGQPPEGSCSLAVVVSGNDGVATSARGSGQLLATVAEIDADATLLLDNIVVRESKVIAGVDKECLKWVKKQSKLRAKCNDQLLRKGPEFAVKCKVADPAEPAGCDPGQHVEALLELAYGLNDQQVDSGSAELIDASLLKDQIKCQKLIGKAAVKFLAKRSKFVQKRCLNDPVDSVDCRAQQDGTARKVLGVIDKCGADQATDDGTGRVVYDVGTPCSDCIAAGVLDRKCLKTCVEVAVAALSDGIVGDVADCGNGIAQTGEFCDDGGNSDGDCCSATCTVESLPDQVCGVGACQVAAPACDGSEPAVCTPGLAGTEGPALDPTCSDLIDNDCDGDLDGVDADCL